MPYHSIFSVEDTQLNVRSAHEALAKADLQHAFFHISSALCTDPLNREWRGILETVIQRAPDPDVFTRSGQAKFDFITLAGRAYIRAMRHQFDEAIPLLGHVAAGRPDAPFLLWAREWVQQHPAAVLLPAEKAGQFMADTLRWVGNVGVPASKEDPRYPNLEAVADVIAALRQAHGQDSLVLFGSSVVLRRLARYDEAIHLAYQANQVQPDWKGAIGVACAFRDAGRVEEAVGWYRHALHFDANDVSPLLDIGDTYLGVERWDEAAGAYQEVLAREAAHPWAEPSLAYARWRKTADPAEKKRLAQMAEKLERATELYARIEPPRPYVNRLPSPGDAMVGALRNVLQFLEENPDKAAGGSVGITVTHPESPSALLGFQLWKTARNYQIGVDVKVEKVQQPDPRLPKSQVEYALWTWDGPNARPSVPAADPRAGEAVAQIAREPFDLTAWDGPARELAQRMGAPWMQQILCVMVHPPPLPDPATDPFSWVQRVQMAAALVIGHMGAAEEAWPNSQRRRALFTLACGPCDWTNDAAIVALAWLARGDQALRADVEGLFRFLESRVPNDGYVSFEHALCHAWLGLGGLEPAEKQRLEAWAQRIHEKEHAMQAPAEDEGRRGGMTLPEYATASARDGTRIPEWDQLINADPGVQEEFMRLQNEARMRLRGIDPNSNEGRAGEMIRQGVFDVQGAGQNAAAAAQQMAQGGGGDPDPTVFPGQKVARLSQYVGLMKGMQTGDMTGALKRAGLDMNEYMQVAQAWGLKFATDPLLTAKFQQMMTS
jgi:tetratricopeptide (TPR) repeat protein